MEKIRTFFNVSKNCSYWVSEFKGQTEKYSDPSKKIIGLDYYLVLKDLVLQKFQCHYQIFQKDWILSNQHIFLILSNITQAFKSKSNISHNENIEFLLYLSIQKQINQAIKLVGVNFTKIQANPLDFAQIIFGQGENVKESVEFLLNLKIQTIHAFNFKNSHSFIHLIEKYDINEILIKNQLIFNHPTHFSDLDQIDIASLPEKEWKPLILNAINQKMVKLSLENIKRG